MVLHVFALICLTPSLLAEYPNMWKWLFAPFLLKRRQGRSKRERVKRLDAERAVKIGKKEKGMDIMLEVYQC